MEKALREAFGPWMTAKTRTTQDKVWRESAAQRTGTRAGKGGGCLMREADYEILSGGGDIAKLPPEEAEDADQVVAEFLDRLVKKGVNDA